MAQTTNALDSDDSAQNLTGEEIAENVSPEARERAQEEFSSLAPGPTDPLHFGRGGTKTQLDEDPISEVNPFQEDLP